MSEHIEPSKETFEAQLDAILFSGFLEKRTLEDYKAEILQAHQAEIQAAREETHALYPNDTKYYPQDMVDAKIREAEKRGFDLCIDMYFPGGTENEKQIKAAEIALLKKLERTVHGGGNWRRILTLELAAREGDK